MSFENLRMFLKIIGNSRSFLTSSSLAGTRELWRLDTRNPFLEIPEAWVTSLDEIEDNRKEIIQLHPDIFRVPPRIDLLHRNIAWQENYRNLTLTKMLSKAEMPGGGRKPWPQKKVGKHHAGSIRSPHFYRGGFAHGVRGPATKFYMLPDTIRLHGLRVALTIKHAQDDLVIVDDFNSLSTTDPQFLHDVADARNWGYSILFIDSKMDENVKNLVEATEQIPTFTVMPLYGMNCYSIMKHETLILSKRVVDELERRMLQRIYKTGLKNVQYRYIDYKEKILAESEHEEDPIQPPFI